MFPGTKFNSGMKQLILLRSLYYLSGCQFCLAQITGYQDAAVSEKMVLRKFTRNENEPFEIK